LPHHRFEQESPVDVHDKLAEVIALVEGARAMPMSASCIVNRGEVLALLDDIEELLPEELRHAELLLQDREAVVDEGRRESARLIAQAHDEATRMVEEARGEAARLLDDAGAEAARLLEQARAEHLRLVDDSAVVQEANRQAADLVGAADAQAATMRAETAEYVDAKLADFEVLLNRTLASVHRGRERLRERDRAEDADRRADYESAGEAAI
jgi:cell division septum initiation protein DivIVA